jgi:galactokinase
MGSHTDYNHGHVLTMAIDRDTWIAVRPRPDRRVRVCSLNAEGDATFDLDDIQPGQDAPWTDYVKGVAAVCQAEGLLVHGFDGLLHSTIPLTSGLSSSAALEVATATVLSALGRWCIEPVRLAALCQRAENQFVGVPCGILDQYTSALGQAGQAVLLDCRALTSTTVRIHDDVTVVICDTRTPRELSGSEYSMRRTQCEEGVALLRRRYPAVTAMRDVSVPELAAGAADLPQVLAHRCRFVVEEEQRVLALAQALEDDSWPRIAALTAASYEGARDLFDIVTGPMESMIAVMRAGPGMIGARQAGAGFGGCMVAFVDTAHVSEYVWQVNKSYAELTGAQARSFAVRPAAGAGLLSGVVGLRRGATGLQQDVDVAVHGKYCD